MPSLLGAGNLLTYWSSVWASWRLKRRECSACDLTALYHILSHFFCFAFLVFFTTFLNKILFLKKKSDSCKDKEREVSSPQHLQTDHLGHSSSLGTLFKVISHLQQSLSAQFFSPPKVKPEHSSKLAGWGVLMMAAYTWIENGNLSGAHRPSR